MELFELTAHELSDKLNVKITPVSADGYEFVDSVLSLC